MIRERLDPDDRSKAHSVESERGVVASMLLDPQRIDDVVLIVRADEFYNESCRELFRAITAIHDKGKTPDAPGVVAWLKKHGLLDLVGGVSAVTDALELLPSAVNATWFAEEVHSRYVQRCIADAAAVTLREAQQHETDAGELAEFFERKAFEIGERRIVGQSKSAYDLMQMVADELDARLRGKPAGMSTGFCVLDQMLVNLRPGTLTLLAARPSMGKSAFAANVAVNIATRNEPVAFFSLEMSYLEIGERMLAARSNVPLNTLQRERPSSDENKRILSGQSDLSVIPLYVTDTPTLSMNEIAAICRRQKRSKGLAIVIIDYLQLVRPENPRDPRQEQVAGIGRRLKGLARELQVPIIALAQLNRATEQAAGNKPKLSNLRESGALEQDADNVLFVHREEYYLPDGPQKDALKNKAEIVIAKQRNGKRGVVPMSWQGHVQRFEDAEAVDRKNTIEAYQFD